MSPMDILKNRTSIIAAMISLLLFQGCNAPTKPSASQAGADTATTEAKKPPPETTPAKEDPEPLPKDGEMCGGTQEKDEAARRAGYVALKAPLQGLKHESILMEFIEKTHQAARDKKFDEMDRIQQDALAEMEAILPDFSGSEAGLLYTAVRARLGAYATCRAIAEDDGTWCTSIDEEWTTERHSCVTMRTVYRRMVVDVMQKGGSCEDALEEVPDMPGVKKEHWMTTCQAVVKRDPERCQDLEDGFARAMCQSAAAGDGRKYCNVLSEETYADTWIPCCVKFGWRLSHVIGGRSTARMIPEVGALQGDVGGCDRAFVWGLFGDLASSFGIEKVEESAVAKHREIPYICGYQVYHSVEPLPWEEF